MTLDLLDTGASRHLANWLSHHETEFEDLAHKIDSHGLAFVIDELSTTVGWTGEAEAFIESATAALSAVSHNIPQLNQTLIPILIDQLSHLYIAPSPSPGELTMALLEALDTLGFAISRQSGAELRRAAIADVAQQLHELDPASTAWPIQVQNHFLDWRTGCGSYGPNFRTEETNSEVETPPQSSTPFKQSVTEPEKHTPQTLDELARGLTLDTPNGREWLETTRYLLQDRGQIILQGPPGTGKTFIAQQLALFLAGHSSRVEIVQFHPATAYEDFIQGLRPKSDGSEGFEMRPDPLLQLSDKARANPDKQHILIIDEINRANLPAVFGVLYFLLEYRSTEIQLTSGQWFTLPENLRIIGTMNTADRSIASIDAALRRRFYIHDLRPEEAPLNEVLPRWLRKHAIDLHWLPNLLTIANKLIDDEDQHIGQSHFLKPDLTEEKAGHAWLYTVLPTLREHFYGQTDRLHSFDFDTLKS